MATAGAPAGGIYDRGSTATVTNISTTGVKSWDVTDMVTSMVRTDSSKGFVVRAASETGINTVTFHSKEATSSSNRPVLVIDWHRQIGRRAAMGNVYEYKLDDRSLVSVDPGGYLVVSTNDFHVDGTGVDADLS